MVHQMPCFEYKSIQFSFVVICVKNTKKLANETFVIYKVTLEENVCVPRLLGIVCKYILPFIFFSQIHVLFSYVQALEQKAKAISGVMQWPYIAVAKSLEVIPRTLIQNCGGNTIRTLTALRVSPSFFLFIKRKGDMCP